MPMRFDDARILRDGEFLFRPQTAGESVEQYRQAFALHRDGDDPIEAHEIRTGTPWNEWTDEQFMDLVGRHPKLEKSNPMVITRLFRRKTDGLPK